VVSPLITYAMAPVNLATVLASCKLCICHAGAATLAQSLMAGVPVFMLPTQAEQLLMARRVSRAGYGIHSPEASRPLSYETLLASMLGNSVYRQAARAFAAKYAGFSASQQVVAMVDEMERLSRL
jgi:UDP:flavonoid glycosyltransferase YjiC (YdhE family)